MFAHVLETSYNFMINPEVSNISQGKRIICEVFHLFKAARLVPTYPPVLFFRVFETGVTGK